ncbi:MAG: CAP domain-containing protein [Nannocystaceae bacterium]|nr:hypothetical protein [bacterium]
MRLRGVLVLLCVVPAAACEDAPHDEMAPQQPLPALARCDAVRDWSPALVELEDRMLRALDERRAQGQSCGAQGSFAPAPPLRRAGALTCAARLHALDMAERGFVEHEGSDGSSAWDRMRAVEYAFATADEVVVATDLPPEDILDDVWLPREGSCAALSATAYTEVGLGVALPFDPDDPLAGRRWTVMLAKPIR